MLTLVSVQRRGSVTVQIGTYQHELARGVTAEIEPGVTVKLTRVTAGQATLALHGPKHIKIWRGEIYALIQAQQAEDARRQRMPELVGQAIAGLFAVLSVWPISLLVQMAVAP